MQHRLSDIVASLGLEADGNLELTVSGAAEPADAGPDDLALAMEESYAEALESGRARVAILWPGADWRDLGLEAALFAPRARVALAGVTDIFATAPAISAGHHPTALIDPTAEIGPGAAIGPYVVIGAGVRIGARARLASHVTINDGAVIGADALLLERVHIGARVQIGDRFIAHPGATLGADGFSFVTPEPGAVEEARATGQITDASRTTGFRRIHSIGSVEIGHDVEIGANSCIDRGTVANTTVGDGTKIDNLVTIGHNVRVGRTCLLCGQSGVGGSTIIGDRVVLGGAAGFADHITVGSDVVVTGKSAVSSNVPPGRIVMGNPAMRMDLAVEAYKALRRLPRVLKRLAPEEKAVSKPETRD